MKAVLFLAVISVSALSPSLFAAAGRTAGSQKELDPGFRVREMLGIDKDKALPTPDKMFSSFLENRNRSDLYDPYDPDLDAIVAVPSANTLKLRALSFIREQLDGDRISSISDDDKSKLHKLINNRLNSPSVYYMHRSSLVPLADIISPSLIDEATKLKLKNTIEELALEGGKYTVDDLSILKWLGQKPEGL